MEKKLTKREVLGLILEVEGVANTPLYVDFINHELELLDRKVGVNKKPTKTQIENVGLATEIYDILVASDSAMAIKDIIVALDKDLSNQKVSAILKALITDNKVERITDKKAVFFKAIVD